MRIAITGGTGFVGRHLARVLVAEGHEVALIARGADRRDESILQCPGVTFFPGALSDPERLAAAFAGCEAVAHCAGINREIGRQTYQRVHVEGTQNVVTAARRSGVGKIVMLSFLRARPDCGSAYHESKWAAEEIVRGSGLDYTIVKSGMIYGRGDHMLDHLSHAFFTFPVVLTVGLREKLVRPLPIQDLTPVLRAALVEGRMSRQTIAITGVEELRLSEAMRRVARVVGKRPLLFPAPVWFHYLLAHIFEATMKIPLAAVAQVRILSEGVAEPAMACESLPADLQPRLRFTPELIREGLPEPGGFGTGDLRCCVS